MSTEIIETCSCGATFRANEYAYKGVEQRREWRDGHPCPNRAKPTPVKKAAPKEPPVTDQPTPPERRDAHLSAARRLRMILKEDAE